MGWAQAYAAQNREAMMKLILSALRRHLPPFEVTSEAVNCHHNYVEREHHFGADVWVTRKGAIRAREGDLGIIPGSMGAKSYIVRGKGAADSFQSRHIIHSLRPTQRRYRPNDHRIFLYSILHS